MYYEDVVMIVLGIFICTLFLALLSSICIGLALHNSLLGLGIFIGFLIFIG